MPNGYPLYALMIDWPEIGAFQKALDDRFRSACAERGAGGYIVGVGGLRVADPAGAALDPALALAEASAIDGFVFGTVSLSAFPDSGELCSRLEARLGRSSVRVEGGGSRAMPGSQGSAFSALMRHLLEDHGYDSFAFVAGPPGNGDSEARLAAFRSALEAAGIPFRDEAVVHGGFIAMGGARAIAELLDERGIVPRAVVCANDMMAAGVVRELLSRGIKVPQEIAVTGFDDAFEGNSLANSLTTVKVDFGELTRRALFSLDDQVHGRAAREYGEAECRFVPRQSCGCPSDDPSGPAGGFAAPSTEAEMEETFAVDDAISDWCQEIIAARDVRVGEGRLATLARSMGIERLRVTLIDDPADLAGSKFRLVAGIEKGVPMALPPEGLPYSGAALTPPGFDLAPGEVVIVDFLAADGKVFGILHSSSGARGRHAYEWLRGRLSSTLHTVWTLKMLEAKDEALKEALKRVEDLSLHDELTGLLNRRGFLAVAGQELGLLKRGGAKAFVFFFDMDGLKAVNDVYGHAEGDWAIAAASRVLRATMRESDVIARLGGDEFTALCASQAPGGAEQIVARLEEACAALDAASGKPYSIRFSVGWIPVPTDGAYASLGALLAEADRLLYETKRRRHAQAGEGAA